MESPNTNPAPRPKLHPLVAAAAVSIIALSGVGIAAMVMNHSNATPSPALAASEPMVPAAALPRGAERTSAPLSAANTAPASAPLKPIHATPHTPARIASATPNYSSSYPATPSYSSSPSSPSYNNPAPVAQAEVCRSCGVVDSVHEIKVKGQGSGVGGVGGAVVGGLLGNQVGGGRGKTAMTVLGAVGGAFAGNEIEKNVRSEIEHQMVVRLDDGTTRTFTQVGAFPYGVGERVRIVNGRVERG